MTGERSEHLLYIGQSTTSPNADFSTPDRFPQIIKLASELEFNLGSEPIISCVATGNPLPASDGVELRKADGTVLKVLHIAPLPSLGTGPAPMLQAPPKSAVSPLAWAAAGSDGWLLCAHS